MTILDSIYQQAQEAGRSIAFPESHDERVLRACAILVEKKILKPVLIGEKETIHSNAKLFGVSLNEIEIISVNDARFSQLSDTLSDIYLQKNKELSPKKAQELLSSPLSFSTLLLKSGYVDGVLAGADYTTADVLRSAFSLLGKKPDVITISGAFLMVLEQTQKSFIFADCAVNIDPSAQQLSAIAISSVDSAKRFLTEPAKVAMLSFSTKGSGKHTFSEKIAQATQLVKSQYPEIAIDGEIQLDAAICTEIAALKTPNSPINGQANVLVFPDLNSGNIGYKLVQRLAGAQAIGPILQGIAKPMNDLSRGCSVEDVVNMAAITAIQS